MATKKELSEKRKQKFETYKEDELKKLHNKILSKVKADKSIAKEDKKTIKAIISILQYSNLCYVPNSLINNLLDMIDPNDNHFVDCREKKRGANGYYNLTPLGELLTELYGFDTIIKKRFESLP
jgi:hypothetical protein